MDGIHPKFVLSKRFPVHAAIEQLNLHALKVGVFLDSTRKSSIRIKVHPILFSILEIKAIL